ncbi:MAG: CCXG family PEP-CTERM protein [Pseudomonadota bacterium]
MLRVGCLLILLGFAPAVLAAWWNPAFEYRLAFDVTNNTAAPLTGQQFLLELTGADAHSDYVFSAAGHDIRFVDATSGQVLSHYTQSWAAGSQDGRFLVLVPSLAVGESRRIHLYYGNPVAPDASDPLAVLTEVGLRYHTRRSFLDPSSLAEAREEFYAQDDTVAGYGCTTLTNFSAIENTNQFSPPSVDLDIAFLSNHHFEVPASEAGTWDFRFGGDYGRGGGMYLDGLVLEEDWNDDRWWNYNWSNTGETFDGSISLPAGWHTLNLMGFEGCCDGGTSVQYRSPAAPGVWRNWSTANVNIRSEKCLPNSGPAELLPALLDASSLSGVDVNGGALMPGDVIRYTLTISESAGVQADLLAARLDIPAGVTSLVVVSLPAGTVDGSTTSGGAFGNGVLDLGNISVAPSGLVTLVFEVTVAGVPAGTLIDAQVEVSNPSGTGPVSVVANQLVVGFMAPPLNNVIKHLYLHENGELSRLVPNGNQANVRLDENETESWTLVPSLQLPLTLDTDASEIRVSLLLRRRNANSDRDLTFTIAGSVSGTIATEYFPNLSLSGNWTLVSFDVDILASAPVQLVAGEAIVLSVFQHSGNGNRRIDIDPSNGSDHSLVAFPTDTAIHLESISFFDAAFPAGNSLTVAMPGDTVYVRAEVSDPFGAFDITGADLEVDDALGANMAMGLGMNDIVAGGWPTGAGKLYERSYTLPLAASSGAWHFGVLAREGTEGTVAHSASNTLMVGPDLNLELTHGAGAASTCFPYAFNLRIVDAGGTTVTGYTGTVSLSTSSSQGGWQSGGAGTLLEADSDDGAATYTFAAADMGEVTLLLGNVHADNLQVTVTDGPNGLVASSSTILFRDNRLLITPADTLALDVIAGRDHQFDVALWQRDSGSGDCRIATEYAGNTAVKAWLTRDAMDPGGVPPGLTGTSDLAVVPNLVPATNNLDLLFNAGVARLVLRTGDVGKYTINLRDDTSGFAVDQAGNPRALDSYASSAPYVVRPFALRTTALGNPGATGPGGAGYVSAGSNFTVTVAGVAYDAADDSGIPLGLAGDGVVDDIAGLGDNPVLPSFGNESETVSLGSILMAPSGGNDPGLAGALPLFSGFTNGQASRVFRFDEVGIILLTSTISDGNYLGAGGVVTARTQTSSLPVGRFYPDHFLVSPGSVGSMAAACTSGTTPFVYSGQAFGWLTTPSFRISPRDASGLVLLNNYQGAFVYLEAGEVAVNYPTADTGNGLPVVATPDTGVLSENGDGSLTYTLGLLDALRYSRTPAAMRAPFVAQLEVELASISETTDSIVATGVPLALAPAGQEIRYGRLRLDNAFGPETEDLRVTARAEYLSATGWATNTMDGCSLPFAGLGTTPDSAPPGSHTGIPVRGGTTDLVFASPLVAGDAAMTFSAPGIGNTGQVGISLDLSSLPFLQFDWDGNGLPDTVLEREAAFGHYRGHDRVIYWREVLD